MSEDSPGSSRLAAFTALGVVAWVAGFACSGFSGPYVPPSQRYMDLPRVVVDHDDFEVTESCRLAFEGPIVDANGDGVIHIAKPGVVVSLHGNTLRGAPEGTPSDLLSGIGIRVTAPKVTVTGGAIAGFKTAIYATRADGAEFSDLNLSDNYAQRLKSTPLAEDGADWLWPHANDKNEWLNQYGAALYIEDSSAVTIRAVHARHGQNGIILDAVSSADVFACDCSYLSGWGLALWRSCDNLVTRNRFDFCVRGYSHGAYNRGQDSAGILCFEQSSRNVFAGNSATHCGDGFFGFAGKEALTQAGPSGCNGNVIYENDFSYAVAHGIELTFSFDNWIVNNRCVGDAICGVWGGYSQLTVISDNLFQECGTGAYGSERGGINIEHGSDNCISGNRFKDNACGVRLWWDEDAELAKGTWAKANGVASKDNSICGNSFEGDRVAVELRACETTVLAGNTFTGCARDLDADDPSRRGLHDSPRTCGLSEDQRRRLARLDTQLPEGSKLGTGAVVKNPRSEHGGREAILIGPEGPYDWVRPRAEFDEQVAAMMRPYGKGVEPQGPWMVRAFATTADPRTDMDAFNAASLRGAVGETNALLLPFGSKGPSDLIVQGAPMLGAAIAEAHLPTDHFGLVATAQFTAQPGCWRIRVVSDDGVRVAMDGKRIIDNWTRHAPAEDTATFAVDAPTTFTLDVKYFELTGHAVLQLFIEACPPK